MKEVNAIIKNCKNPVKCPICNNNMVYIIKGELFGNKWSKLNDEGLQYGKDYINLGILFGDDRDSVWICKQCKKNYDADLEEIYIDCQVAKFNCIPERYCKNIKKIKELYGIKKNAHCENCIHFK